MHNRRITSLDCTKDGDFIVSGSEDGMVCYFGVGDLFRSDVVRHTWCEHTLAVSQVVCCVGDGYRAVSVGKDALVVVMELFSGLVRTILIIYILCF